MTKLSPIVSEFETEEEAEAYDRWFRAKVEAALADPRPGIPHDEVIAEIDRIIAEKAAQRIVARNEAGLESARSR